MRHSRDWTRTDACFSCRYCKQGDLAEFIHKKKNKRSPMTTEEHALSAAALCSGAMTHSCTAGAVDVLHSSLPRRAGQTSAHHCIQQPHMPDSSRARCCRGASADPVRCRRCTRPTWCTAISSPPTSCAGVPAPDQAVDGIVRL